MVDGLSPALNPGAKFRNNEKSGEHNKTMSKIILRRIGA